MIIPSSSRTDLLHACLDSLARCGPRELPYETIVVLNEASQDAAAELRESVKGVQVLGSPVNLGLAGAGNRGRDVARGDLLVLLHDDAEIEAGWLEALVQTVDAQPEAGAVGGKVLFPDGRLQSTGMILWSNALASPPWAGETPPPTAFERLRAVDYCGTSSLLVRAAAWDAVGGLDERFYPLYYVDNDLGMALRRLGLVVLCQPGSRIRHHQGASGSDRFRSFVAERNRLLFIQKWGTALADYGTYEPSSPDAVEQALARAESFADTCRNAVTALDPPPGRAMFDPVQQQLDHIDKSLALQKSYIALLSKTLDQVEQDRARWQNAAMAYWYLLGTTIRFCIDGEAFQYQVAGHHAPEPWGAWIGHDALKILLPIVGFVDGPGPPSRPLTMVLEVLHFLNEERDVSPMRVVVNGETLLQTDERRAGPQQYALALPSTIRSSSGHLLIEVEPAGARSPAQMGGSDDERPLSIGMISLTIHEKREME